MINQASWASACIEIICMAPNVVIATSSAASKIATEIRKTAKTHTKSEIGPT